MSAAVAEFRDPVTARGFTQLENVVLFDTRLSVGARVVYGALKHFAWRGQGEVPAQPEFADALGVSERSLRSHLKELITAELITMSRRRSKPNLYVIEPVAASLRSRDSLKVLKKGSGKICRNEPAKSAGTVQANIAGTNRAIWDAFVAARGAAPATKSERGKWNRGIKELREAGVTADNIAQLIAAYRKEWPRMELTPTGLSANLSKFAEAGRSPHETRAERLLRMMAERGEADA